jgi:hypothetical protein
MCYSATYSFMACGLIWLYTYAFRAKMSRFLIAQQFYWSSMELLQGFGYIYPNNVVIPYLLMAHTITQPMMYFSGYVYKKHNSFLFAEYKYIYYTGLVTLALFIPRFFSDPVIPCNDVFCSLQNNPTPRCVIIPGQHMTWSVPLGYTFNELYITPSIYMHFLFLFVYSAIVAPTNTLFVYILTMCIRFRLVNQMNDVYLERSIGASIWCYIGVIISGGGIREMILDLIERKRRNTIWNKKNSSSQLRG